MESLPEIRECLLEVVATGIINIRSEATRGNCARCFIEADHIHNLPTLVCDFSHELLKFYLDVEKPAYISQSSGAETKSFESVWARLERAVKAMPK
jgi:hypothetical protein